MEGDLELCRWDHWILQKIEKETKCERNNGQLTAVFFVPLAGTHLSRGMSVGPIQRKSWKASYQWIGRQLQRSVVSTDQVQQIDLRKTSTRLNLIGQGSLGAREPSPWIDYFLQGEQLEIMIRLQVSVSRSVHIDTYVGLVLSNRSEARSVPKE